MISYLSLPVGGQMGKCGVFIPSHSHQAVPIPIPVKLAERFPFQWDSHGTHWTHGNSRIMHTSTSVLVNYMSWLTTRLFVELSTDSQTVVWQLLCRCMCVCAFVCELMVVRETQLLNKTTQGIYRLQQYIIRRYRSDHSCRAAQSQAATCFTVHWPA